MKHPAEVDMQTARMRELLVQWGNYSRVSARRKREDDEVINTSSQPRKKQSLHEPRDKSDEVDIFPAHENLSWYLGGKGDDFFVRKPVQDLASRVLDILSKAENDSFPTVCLISGAAGIGKSWSINLFMTKLLCAGKQVFFHSGGLERAWKITDVNTIASARSSGDIVFMDKEWIYVYDSPGSKLRGEQCLSRTGKGHMTLIFSSPKSENYGFALSKTNGVSYVFHLPRWHFEAMVKVKGEEKRKLVRASFDIWGGNLRALDSFLALYEKNSDEAENINKKAISAQIDLIDKEFALKMTNKLEKQEVENKFMGEAVKNSPGHILTPEPTSINLSDKDAFQDFQWRFCSPFAEKKFFEHAKKLDLDILKKLLISVFQVPSPKGILFEKVSHLVISSGICRGFKCRPYIGKGSFSMSFQPCVKFVGFATHQLKEAMKTAASELHGKSGGIALEPLDASFDAVDMFVLESNANTFSLYLLQDTIAKKHSFHPVKVLWYCSIFCDVCKEILQSSEQEDSDLLKRCKYVPIVPRAEAFSFEEASGSSTWKEIERVKALVGCDCPEDFQAKLKASKPTFEKSNLP